MDSRYASQVVSHRHRKSVVQAVYLVPLGLAPFALGPSLEPPLLGHEPPDPVDQVRDIIVWATPLAHEQHAAISLALLHR